MLVFGTQMELVTLLFTGVEVAMFFYQAIYCLSRPEDKARLWYLILLFILIFYNITGGLFPDPSIHGLTIVQQNILAYAGGFAVACYIPFYFYKVLGLRQLRFMAYYGIWIFLVLPFIVFFLFFYAIDGNLEHARERSVLIPFLYAIVFDWIILRLLFKKLSLRVTTETVTDTLIVCCAVIPWSTMPIMAFYDVNQVLEESVCNGGFLVITFLLLLQSIRTSRAEYHQLKEINLIKESPGQRFQENCRYYNLTPREIDIVILIDKGIKYKAIAETLFIAERTISKHVQNIYSKTGVSNKVELINKIYR